MSGAEVIIDINGARDLVGSLVGAGEGAGGLTILDRRGVDDSSRIIFLAEEVLFCKTFWLPSNTSNLKEAILYQLEMLVPFPEDSFYYSYSTDRQKDKVRVTLYAVLKERVDPYLAQLKEEDISILGLFPESLRYLVPSKRKEKWALFYPGHLGKIIIFDHGCLVGRVFCSIDPSLEEAREFAGCETIFFPNPEPESGFEDANTLLAEMPLAKEFNLLPSVYRQRDYYKIIIKGLVALNLFLFVTLGCFAGYQFYAYSNKIDSELSKLRPEIELLSSLADKEQALANDIKRLMVIGKSPDFMAMFVKLTKQLPDPVYLDQVRLDKKRGIVVIQGYAEDISELTTKLQGIGEIRLKSTSLRKNKNYFQIEIGLQ